MSPLETDFFTQDYAFEIYLSRVLFFKLWRSVPLYGFGIVLFTHPPNEGHLGCFQLGNYE